MLSCYLLMVLLLSLLSNSCCTPVVGLSSNLLIRVLFHCLLNVRWLLIFYSPNVLAVNKISVTNGHLTDNGIGHVSIDLTIDPRQGYNNYWRAGKVRVPSGDNTITFDEPFTDNDYFVVAAYALLDELDTRQNLVYGNQTAGGFDVYDVIDSAYVHYLAIRDIDSLLTSIEDIGHILATPSDPTLGYLSNKVDDTTMVVKQ